MLIIALSELITIVVFAAARGPAWGGAEQLDEGQPQARRPPVQASVVVIYVGDNQVVDAWLEKRTAHNRWARYLLRILRYIEVKCHFTLLSSYIRTYRNVTNDMISRETKAVVRAKIGGKLGSRRFR